MKWHLKVISTIIHLSILGYSLFCLANILGFFTSFAIGRYDSLQEAVVLDYFHRPLDRPSPIITYLFVILNVLLHLYLITRLWIARNVTSRLHSGEFIYSAQAEDFRKVGGGFVIFAKLRYVLLMIMGVFFMNDVQILIVALPNFLLFYLLGKILLVISAITRKGEVLKTENELTI